MRAVLCVDLEDDYAAPAVECDLIDVGKDRRLDMMATDIAQLFFDVFRILDSLDAQLVVDSEYHCAASRVGQRYDFSGQFFDVAESDLEFEVGILTATHQSQQFSARRNGSGYVVLIGM